jgi:hypothetical protein
MERGELMELRISELDRKRSNRNSFFWIVVSDMKLPCPLHVKSLIPRISTIPVIRTLAVMVPFLLTATFALAKRAAPVPVPPVVAESVEYSAPHDHMGVVVATDTKEHKELWRKEIYAVKIDPNLESDVQHVFITGLAIDGKSLVVANERGERYSIDLTSKKITKLK